MSIIYDALKKVETSQASETKPRGENKTKPKPKLYLSYLLIICIGLFIANLFYGSPKNNSLATTTNTQIKVQVLPDKNSLPNQPLDKIAASVEPVKESPSELVLNGVFFSGNEGYALINNRVVRKGEKVDGATLMQILLNEVELERDGSIIKLSINKK